MGLLKRIMRGLRHAAIENTLLALTVARIADSTIA